MKLTRLLYRPHRSAVHAPVKDGPTQISASRAGLKVRAQALTTGRLKKELTGGVFAQTHFQAMAALGDDLEGKATDGLPNRTEFELAVLPSSEGRQTAPVLNGRLCSATLPRRI